MKISQFLLAALSGASLSTALPDCPATTGLPACGLLCMMSAAADINCGIEDIICQCTSSSQLMAAASTCLAAQCTDADDTESVTNAAEAICASCATPTPTSAPVPPSSPPPPPPTTV